MKLTLGRKILVGFIICVLILLGVAVFTYKNSESYIDSNEWVDHTNKVLYEFTQILVNSVDIETGVRGFVITGDEKYLEPFKNGNEEMFNHLVQVKELTKDNSTQQKNIEELETELKKHISHLNSIILQRRIDAEKTREIVHSGEGKQIEDNIRKIIDRSKKIEQTLLAERKKSSAEDARNFNLVFGILILIIVLVLVSVYLVITSNLRAIKKAETETAHKNWLLSGNAALNDKIQGEKEVEELAQQVIKQLTTYLKAEIGAIYLAHEDHLNLVGSYAFDYDKNKDQLIRLGEGLVGQAALDKKPIIFKQVPDNYIKINSGLGKTTPKNIVCFPFKYSGYLKGVIEIGTIREFSDLDLQLLKLVAENIGIAFNSAQSRTKLKELLEETQVQSEELQTQQEELKQMNEELEEQTQSLKQQREELQIINEELEEQTQTLEMKNKEVEEAKKDIEQKTKQLEISSQYKSEFLANMSHELRTPLNSLLILSKDLSENRKKNLHQEQIESAEIIYKSGHDLLTLINEVLDLSKIEAGKMVIHVEAVSLLVLLEDLLRDFKHQAEKKGLKLTSYIEPGLSSFIYTDEQRLNQVLKNLLSNAVKFTQKGSINIHIGSYTQDALIISVKDTGIGIPEEKQMAIFGAFQQADGGTARKYGGTGLGLSISRELARLLHIEIRLVSKLNEGSTFSLIVPLKIKPQDEAEKKLTFQEQPFIHSHTTNNHQHINYPTLEDDRNNILKEDKVVLIIEYDLNFGGILFKQAKEKGFKCIFASSGEDGLTLATKYKPNAIILDNDLPGMNGHQVLIELKKNPSIRHIPVHMVSEKGHSLNPVKDGAIEYLMKPISKTDLEKAFTRIQDFINRKMKNLLIIEDDENSRKTMRKLIGNGDVKCFEVATAQEAIKIYKEQRFDCIVLDIGLPDMTGFELIHQLGHIKDRSIPPIIIYTGKELTKEENHELEKYTKSIIIKGVKSEERLLDETALFLHRTISNLPESKQEIINNLYDKDTVFHQKKILLVDDDMRNVFALSKILKDHRMEIITAENGINALEMLDKNPWIDLVLMDIMMPEMDGYEATKQIRLRPNFQHLPIIALTAKAMKDDRKKCMDAGANDYITKPVDIDKLLTLMRVWLTK